MDEIRKYQVDCFKKLDRAGDCSGAENGNGHLSFMRSQIIWRLESCSTARPARMCLAIRWLRRPKPDDEQGLFGRGSYRLAYYNLAQNSRS